VQRSPSNSPILSFGAFQFSPALGGGCNTIQPHTVVFYGVARFNSHPPLGAGATRIGQEPIRRRTTMFQFSPALGGGCNQELVGRLGNSKRVSILTRPWGRVQRPCKWQTRSTRRAFQFSPALGGECNSMSFWVRTPWAETFQFSPALGGECNGAHVGSRRNAEQPVSILTRPWGRVQHPIY